MKTVHVGLHICSGMPLAFLMVVVNFVKPSALRHRSLKQPGFRVWGVQGLGSRFLDIVLTQSSLIGVPSYLCISVVSKRVPLFEISMSCHHYTVVDIFH